MILFLIAPRVFALAGCDKDHLYDTERMLSVVLSMNEQSHYKQEKTKARPNKAKLKRDIFNSGEDKAFQWSKQATSAFKELQQAMIQSPVLALPNFEEESLIETDASGYGGKENVVVDALSRVQHGQLFKLLIFDDSNELIEAVKATSVTDLRLKAIIEGLQQGIPNSNITWSVNELRRKGKLVVGNDDVKLKIIKQFHNSAIGGHSGVQATLKRICAFFYWKGLRRMVKQQVHLCDVCQRNKLDLAASPGLLQPLKIPERVWKDISIDFIEGTQPSFHCCSGASGAVVYVNSTSSTKL
ncbi:retrotransposable element Tf2 [Tanacetum coccineum]